MVGNLSPLLTVFLAYFILGERLSKEKAVQLVLAFIAVTMMVLGGNKSSLKLYTDNIFALVVLLLNPVAISFGMIAMRSMRSTEEWTVSSYNYLCQLLVMTPCVLIWEEDLGLIFTFGLTSWLLLVITSVMGILFQNMIFKALKYHKATAL